MAKLGIQYDELMNPVLQALKSLGGSGTNEEINHKVSEIVDLSPEEYEILHNPDKGARRQALFGGAQRFDVDSVAVLVDEAHIVDAAPLYGQGWITVAVASLAHSVHAEIRVAITGLSGITGCP